jgi:prepilin peptidase CpaA
MSPFEFLQAGCLALFALLLVAAAVQDLRSMRIGNPLSFAVVGLYVTWACAGMIGGRVTPMHVAIAVGLALAVFVVGAMGFAAGVVGGGDVKLLGAASLFAGPDLIVDFLLITAIVGGVLGLALLAGAPIGPSALAQGNNVTVRARLRSRLPYGPAIAAGGLWTAAALTMS